MVNRGGSHGCFKEAAKIFCWAMVDLKKVSGERLRYFGDVGLALGGFAVRMRFWARREFSGRLWPAFGFGPFLWPSSELAIAES